MQSPLPEVNPWFLSLLSGTVEEGSINVGWEMVGGTCQQSNPLSRLCSINTLANTMKHCINVSNYWQDGTLASGGRGVLRRCGDAIRMSHWLSISPTDVEKGLPIKTAQIRGGLSGNYMLCDLGKKIRKTRWWRKQGKSLNQNILKSIGSECHVNLFKYLAKILITLQDCSQQICHSHKYQEEL